MQVTGVMVGQRRHVALPEPRKHGALSEPRSVVHFFACMHHFLGPEGMVHFSRPRKHGALSELPEATIVVCGSVREQAQLSEATIVICGSVREHA